jgi:hypothetical protein
MQVEDKAPFGHVVLRKSRNIAGSGFIDGDVVTFANLEYLALTIKVFGKQIVPTVFIQVKCSLRSNVTG